MLALLFLAFAAPYFGAWFVFNYTNFWRDNGAARHGQLIQPPRPLPDLSLVDADGREAARLHGKWTLVYVMQGACDQACADNLYRMRQLRLTVGRDATRVQRLVVVYGADPATLLSPGQKRDYAGQLVLDGVRLHEGQPGAEFRLHAGDQALDAHRLYLVDPLGNLMMAYPPDTAPNGITADLKRLLKYSHIG